MVYGRYDGQFQTPWGQAITGASVYFLTQPANVRVFTPLANVYSDSSGTPTTNPVLTSGLGTVAAYLEPGIYTVVYYSQITGRVVLYDQLIVSPDANSEVPQSPNTVFAGPASGDSAAAPAFRTIVASDLSNVLSPELIALLNGN